jgi:uncharacterized protein (TIGR03663 family)
VVGLLFATGLALALLCPQLDYRPMHNDEAVNAIKFGQLWQHGTYKYDPNEHHGPSLFYATLAFSRLTAAPDFDHFTETRLRLVTVLFGLGLVLLLPLVADGLGRHGSIWAALFTAFSPAIVFYSRYFIHETLLVFFTFLTMAAGWRYWRSRKIGWALLAGAGLGLMHATKETFVLSVVAAILALALNQTWNRWLDATGLPVKAPLLNYKHLAAGVAVWALVWLVAFSSFFSNAGGLLDSFRTYSPWLSRAGGDSPHIHPWHFYLHRLLFYHIGKGPIWTEALILILAAIAGLAAFARKGLGDAKASFLRFLALYAIILAAAYSFLSYKTPWCLLTFWQPTILLAGTGAMILIRQAAHPLGRTAVTAVLLAGVGHLGWEAWQASIPHAADPKNPYVYSPTSPDILNLVHQVDAIARVSPAGQNLLIKVIASEDDYWPLPWYLRRFKQVGWWGQMPPDPFASVLIVSTSLEGNLPKNQNEVATHIFALRPGVFFDLYVEPDLWKQYLEKNRVPKQ